LSWREDEAARLNGPSPPRGNPCCGFELMKNRASAVCASLSMTAAMRDTHTLAKNWRKHVTAVDNTMTAP
jgi:hypothetical protein